MEELKLINIESKINEDNTFGLTLEFLTKENQKVSIDFYKISPITSEVVAEDNRAFYLKLLPSEDGYVSRTYTKTK